jgi:general secretion pathway protein L
MEGETTSFDAVERLKQTFSASPQLKDVAVTETRVGAGPNQVVFRITVRVEQP